MQRGYAPNDKALIQLLLDNDAVLCCDSGSNNTLFNAAFRAPRNFNAAPDPDTGYPYDETVAEEITDVFLLLAEHCNSNGVGDAGRTPLHCAALMENWHLVRMLVAELDYAPDAKDINGKTAYDFAKESNAPEDVLELLQPAQSSTE